MPPATSSTHLSPAELSYLHTSLSSHPAIRPDSRTQTDFRPLNAETGVLPNTMGSAHVGFADGREAVVGVRAEVEKTATGLNPVSTIRERGDGNDVDMTTVVDSEGQMAGGRHRPRGKAEWVTLGLVLPGMRDDDKDLVFLEEMLRETLVGGPSTAAGGTSDMTTAQSLQDALVINYRWHWRLYIDVLLISAPDQATSSSTSGSRSSSGGTYPLPLLSMAVHLALRDTRLPRLKSEGDEDPVADDDWDAAVHLYATRSKSSSSHSIRPALLRQDVIPPVTLLVMVVAENVIFDPSSTELAVADGVLAISVGRRVSLSDPVHTIEILAVRTLETPARDTMKGVPREVTEAATSETGQTIAAPGVWKPKIGGINRAVLMKVIKTVVTGGVGRDVFDGLDGFVGGT